MKEGVGWGKFGFTKTSNSYSAQIKAFYKAEPLRIVFSDIEGQGSQPQYDQPKDASHREARKQRQRCRSQFEVRSTEALTEGHKRVSLRWGGGFGHRNGCLCWRWQ